MSGGDWSYAIAQEQERIACAMADQSVLHNQQMQRLADEHAEHMRPSRQLRVELSGPSALDWWPTWDNDDDGQHWTCTYSGVYGHGPTPEAATAAFDTKWRTG